MHLEVGCFFSFRQIEFCELSVFVLKLALKLAIKELLKGSQPRYT